MRVFIFLLGLFAIVSAVAGTVTVRPLWIHDGDTFKATLVNKAVMDCRIWGIDAPELDQAWGKVAKSALIELIHNKQVEITIKGKSYNRQVVQITVNGRDIGLELIKMGLAWHSDKHASEMTEYQQAQEEAQKEKRGLWGDRKPVAPWEWRENRKKN